MDVRLIGALKWLLACAAVGLAVGCRPAPDEPADPVVARWEGAELPRSLFVDEYRRYASMAPVQDDLQARRNYARHMLERLLIAEQGRAAGIDSLPEVAAHVRRQRAWAMRRTYLQQTIGRAIPEPEEAAVREAFRRASTRLQLQQIYAATASEADSLHRLLRRGVPFDTLAAASMRRYGVPNPDDAGRMGWVTWNDMDLAPESTAYALDPGAVSAPVASLRGWHIFRLLDREEIVRVDATAYQNARERLQFEWRQRRFDEASARHIRALMEAHAVELHLHVLRRLWPALAPLVPDEPSPYALARATEEVSLLAPEAVPRSTPVAYLDGEPFTAGQFLGALPNVPLAYWRPDLREALEIALRDEILTSAARAARADTARAVQQAERQAAYTARYYATLRAAADTLADARARRLAYELWKDEQFLDHRATTYRAYIFSDSAAAWSALRAYQRSGDWHEAVASGGAAPAVEERRAVSTAPGAVPVHAVALPKGGGTAIAGPYIETEGWTVAEVLAHENVYVPFGEAAERLGALLPGALPAVVHRALLPAAYRPEAVRYDDAMLAESLPFHDASDF